MPKPTLILTVAPNAAALPMSHWEADQFIDARVCPCDMGLFGPCEWLHANTSTNCGEQTDPDHPMASRLILMSLWSMTVSALRTGRFVLDDVTSLDVDQLA